MSRNYFGSMTNPSTYPYAANYGPLYWAQQTETPNTYLDQYRINGINPGHNYAHKYIEPDSTQPQDVHKKSLNVAEMCLSPPAVKTMDSTLPAMITSRPHHNSKRKPTPVQDDRKDEHYYDRRHRNNESAKKSRLNRKMREENAQRICENLKYANSLLSQERERLIGEVQRLRRELGLPPLSTN